MTMAKAKSDDEIKKLRSELNALERKQREETRRNQRTRDAIKLQFRLTGAESEQVKKLKIKPNEVARDLFSKWLARQP